MSTHHGIDLLFVAINQIYIHSYKSPIQ